MSRFVRRVLLALALTLLAAACGSSDEADSGSPSTLAAEPGAPSDEATTTTAQMTGSDTAVASDVDSLPPVDLGLPQIGTITDLEVGDISCYATVVDGQGSEANVGATSEICERSPELLGSTSRLTYRLESVSACESSEPCDETRDEWLVSDALTLGQDWLQMANDDWDVTVGRLDSWAAVDDTGDLTLSACDVLAGCVSLEGGTAGCGDGTCTMSWTDGDSAYLVIGPIAEFGEPGPSTLQVLESGAVTVESPGLEVTLSSDGAVVPRVIDFDPGEFGSVVSDAVVLGDQAEYSVESEADQTMVVSITSLEDNAVFDLYSPSGTPLAVEATEFEVASTAAGVYRLVVGGTRGNATYDLAVTKR